MVLIQPIVYQLLSNMFSHEETLIPNYSMKQEGFRSSIGLKACRSSHLARIPLSISYLRVCKILDNRCTPIYQGHFEPIRFPSGILVGQISEGFRFSPSSYRSASMGSPLTHLNLEDFPWGITSPFWGRLAEANVLLLILHYIQCWHCNA